ncbi:hypothetical protein O6H91_16G038800 [Diphasiastrum complanatum]|uniref:Uncharacterized protein n=1 Tax=Diphasiastrum complanatum TaxID=34168 RepID=A0ACC2BBL7_DIPCM|nr:hypothetical protein O6H91_16G038800 [Diphasiastrum complanatum]
MKWSKCCSYPLLTKLLVLVLLGSMLLASILTLPRKCESPNWLLLSNQLPAPKSPRTNLSHESTTPKKPTRSPIAKASSIPPITNPACVSKWQHLMYRKPSSLVAIPSDLALALKSYEEMHARCTQGKNWGATFYNPRADDPCRYLVYVEGTAGLGNRLLSLASAFAYALLTDRVLLMDPRGHIPLLLCEPFGSSSWLLPKDFPIWDMEYGSPKLGEALSAGLNSSRVLLSLRHEQSDGDRQFYCSAVLGKLDRVPWIGWHSNQYLIPRFFTLPALWPRLLRLFPDVSLASTHLSRYLFLPNNELWERILRIHWSYFACSGKKVSLQVRLHARQDTAEFYPPAFSQIMRCLIGNLILPNVTRLDQHANGRIKPLSVKLSQSRSKAEMAACKMTTSVLVASLQMKYYEELKGLYMNNPTEDDTFVRVHMATHDGSEVHSLDQSVKAFTEIWLLSMGDELATSSWSTFGYVAQSLGALRPYVMNIRGGFDKESLTPCFVGQSFDPCNHYPFLGQCEGETPNSEHTQWIETHIKPCQDEGGGIQLVQKSSSFL